MTNSVGSTECSERRPLRQLPNYWFGLMAFTQNRAVWINIQGCPRSWKTSGTALFTIKKQSKNLTQKAVLRSLQTYCKYFFHYSVLFSVYIYSLPLIWLKPLFNVIFTNLEVCLKFLCEDSCTSFQSYSDL